MEPYGGAVVFVIWFIESPESQAINHPGFYTFYNSHKAKMCTYLSYGRGQIFLNGGDFVNRRSVVNFASFYGSLVWNSLEPLQWRTKPVVPGCQVHLLYFLEN